MSTLPGAFDAMHISPSRGAGDAAATPERPMAEVPVGILRVTVVKAVDLPNMDYTGHSDPFVELAVDMPVALAKAAVAQRKVDDAKLAAADKDKDKDGEKHKAPKQYPIHYAKTTTEDNTGSPVYHQGFVFPIHTLGGPRVLRLEVYDEDSISGNDIIGYGAVNLVDLFAATEHDEPLVATALPPAPTTPARTGGETSDDDDPTEGGQYVSTAEAGLTPRQATRTVWVPLHSAAPDAATNAGALAIKPAGKVLLLVHYVPRTRVQRAKERISGKISGKVSEAKTKLTGKVTGWLADMTASSIKASFS
ncbi:hypothetical protein H9P43_002139 [Blastocladiella emersonii ATCC 22665]|nr:hypothetical protein H9P43_002139 [Blastocladiella emersonii ATCC 22665]